MRRECGSAARPPGVLGAVAAEIGAVDGNVIGLEVLEREAGVAIDELVVELPDQPGAIEAACRGVRNIPGAGVEDVTVMMTEAKDREDTVLAAAAGILQAATATAAINALTGHLITLFDLTWLALADDELAGFAEVFGDVPSVQWVAAFAEGRAVAPTRLTTRRARACSLSRLPRPASPSAVAGRRPSGAGSDTRSHCWSWWRRASSTRSPGGLPPSRSPERTMAAPARRRTDGAGATA